MSNVTVQEALKAAIEHLTEWRDLLRISAYGLGLDDNFPKVDNAIYQCKTALSEIEKCEPVAWMDEFGNIVSAKWEELYGDGTIYNRPLYTSPISKEWVGLTYKDKVDLRENTDWYNFPNDLIEATEAKLKQLNTVEKG